MDFKDIHNIPNIEVILSKMKDSEFKIETSFVGEVIFEAVDNLIVKGSDKFHICEGDAMNLAMSLIISTFMTFLAYPLGDDKEKLLQLVEECNIPIKSFKKRSGKLKKHKECDA